MTVKDLIQYLSTLNPNLEVWQYSDPAGEYSPATSPPCNIERIGAFTGQYSPGNTYTYFELDINGAQKLVFYGP